MVGTRPPPPHKCIRKRTFHLSQTDISACAIRIDYHYGESRITSSSKTFYKDGTPTRVVEVDPLERTPKDSDLLEEFQRLLAAEKQCTQDIRDVEKEIKDMINNRNKEEQNISLVTPYYDIVRVKQEESDDEGDKDEEKAIEEFAASDLGQRALAHAAKGGGLSVMLEFASKRGEVNFCETVAQLARQREILVYHELMHCGQDRKSVV